MINSAYNYAATIVQSNAFRWTSAAVGIPVALYTIKRFGSYLIQQRPSILEWAATNHHYALARMTRDAGWKIPNDKLRRLISRAVKKKDLDQLLLLRTLSPLPLIIPRVQDEFVKTMTHFFHPDFIGVSTESPKNDQLALAWLFRSAIRSGNPEIAEHCISRGIANYKDYTWGFSPLHAAVKRGCLATVRKLVENGADIHAACPKTPHCIALENDHYEIAEYLFDQGANNESYERCLKTALEKGDYKKAEYLVDQGANVGKIEGCLKNVKAQSPAALASLLYPLIAEGPCPSIIKFAYKMLKKETAPKIEDGRYCILLDKALIYDYERFYNEEPFFNVRNSTARPYNHQISLNLGCIYEQSLDWMEEEKWTTADRCLWIDKLIDLGLDSNIINPGWAFRCGKFDLACLLWNKGGKKIFFRDLNLHALNKWLDYVLSLNAPLIFLRELEGCRHPGMETVCKMAREISQVALFSILQDKFKEKDVVPVLEKLLGIVDNPNLKDHYDLTLLHLASKSSNPVCVEVLIRAGANPNLQNREGGTALHCAAHRRDTKRNKTIEILLAAGADPTILDNFRNTYEAYLPQAN